MQEGDEIKIKIRSKIKRGTQKSECTPESSLALTAADKILFLLASFRLSRLFYFPRALIRSVVTPPPKSEA